MPLVLDHAIIANSARATIIGLLLLGGLPAQAQPAADDPIKTVRPVTDAMLLHPDPGDWVMWRRTYDGFGFSPLNQITRDNVHDLRVAWAWSMTNGITEIEPLEHDGVLYLWNAGEKVQALNAVTGDLIWEFRHHLPDEISHEGVNNFARRNMALYQGNLLIATADARLMALDAKTGKVVWDHVTADWKQGFRYTSGPVVMHGVVIQGMAGCDRAQPGGCFITGHDAATGAEKWRVHTIAQPDDPNSNSWNGLPVEQRFGASSWIAGTYDPKRDLAYFGTGQPYPWIAEMRGTYPLKVAPGISNTALYSDSTLAIDVSSGQVKWYHQHLANDTWDLDEVFERILIDLPIRGAAREILVTTGKLGIIDALDRGTGEFLWARETVPQTIVDKIDPVTGARTINPATIPHIGQTTMHCPANPGARNWPTTAYDPTTQTLYLPLNELCGTVTPTPFQPGETYVSGGRAIFARSTLPGSDGKIGRVDAIHLTDRSTTWSARQVAPTSSGVLPTAGGVVFAGGWDRVFRALDAASGKELWRVRANNVINGGPISYSVNGRQYIAVTVGNGSGLGQMLATLVPKMAVPDGGSALWVFALPEPTPR
jgi:alcohol dehydrogenase (cytochrome c)